MSARDAPPDAGFTLIELMISLGLFALIAVAGMGLVDGVLGVSGRTEARLDRLADVQRATFAFGSDLEQLTRGPLTGDATQLRFSRAAPGVGGPPVAIGYRVTGGVLVREMGARPQRLLEGVDAARFRFFDNGWQDGWPPSREREAEWPRAVSVEMEVRTDNGLSGRLRRVVTLPVPPQDPR